MFSDLGAIRGACGCLFGRAAAQVTGDEGQAASLREEGGGHWRRIVFVALGSLFDDLVWIGTLSVVLVRWGQKRNQELRDGSDGSRAGSGMKRMPRHRMPKGGRGSRSPRGNQCQQESLRPLEGSSRFWDEMSYDLDMQ